MDNKSHRADAVPDFWFGHPRDYLLAGFLKYAERHKIVIDRFGRFPHRNTLLGRISTAEETAFLAQPGPSFM